MTGLDPAEYRRLLDVETVRLASVDAASLSSDIPHIAGWTVHSVVGHTAWLLRYISLCLQASPDDPPARSAIGEPPVGADVFPWFAEAAERVRAILADADLDTMRPTWTGPQPTSWWLRRVTQEIAMHRWDAQSATGLPDPIDTDLARDGIEEVLEVFVPNRLQFDVLAGTGETIHLHATDAADGEWMLDLQPDEVRWGRGHAKGDAAARGPMADLLLLLWSRIPPSRLEVFGDVGLLDRWQEAAKF
ncbi:MAG: maleylpyruvate isomerase family mycothiol-dependent enzyme [Acidimicrobiia bacterium]|nr:maleylpyruvate isomerase family mycothiol-dependent enzyme [Acidimicrobiia bacterium]